MPINSKSSADTSLAVIVLAAGNGTRMRSSVPKILHKVAGLSMAGHVCKVSENLDPEKIVFVVGPEMDAVQQEVTPHACAIQKTPCGTADAVKVAQDALKDFEGNILVLYGDVPLMRAETLQELIQHHESGNFDLTVLAMAPPNPHGYGRIVQNPDGTLKTIIEQLDASEEEKNIRLVNSGIMMVKSAGLQPRLERIEAGNEQKEYYLTDLPAIIQEEGGQCGVIRGDWEELQGVNSKEQLAAIEAIIQRRYRKQAMDAGTILQDPSSVYFSFDTILGADCVIEPHVVFGPNVHVHDGACIRAFSHLEGTEVKQGAVIGPFARLRPGTTIEAEAKIGNFVEIKNSFVGEGSKVNHLSYIGDSQLGSEVNIGAGTITCNYDGFAKHKTDIGEGAFVGSNSTLIAPLKIEKGAYIAAGSTMTKNVPQDALGIGRSKSEISEGWAVQYRKKKSKKS